MNRFAIFFFALVAAVMLVVTGCSKKQTEQEAQTQGTLGSATGTVAGVQWAVPQKWTGQGQRPMRIATYTVPASEGDPEAGECAVSFFGAGQGGNVDANIDRWVGQFESAGTPARASREVNGLKVSLVQIAGSYLAPGGPMMQSQGKKENYRLLGAIVEGPEGMIFFKLTGPAKTLAASEGDFNAMIGSLKK